MKFFIDTANLSQIQEAQDLGVLDGVTTNPSLMAKEGIVGRDNILKHYQDICELVDGDVSAEVIATDYENIIREGEELAALHEQIVVKAINKLTSQVSQLSVEKALLQAELDLLKEELANLKEEQQK